MESEEPGRPRLTAKGERTRARIVEAAARLIYERGVASTTLDDVKVAAGVSGSQMYHYFPDKDDLLQAVISYQADVIAGNQRQADLGSAAGLRAWRDMVIAQAGNEEGKGGCPRLTRGPARRDRPARPSPAGWRIRAMAGRHRRGAAPPAPGRTAAGHHRPGRPRRHPPRHAPGRPSPRPGPAGPPPAGNGGRHPSPARPERPARYPGRQRNPLTGPPALDQNPGRGERPAVAAAPGAVRTGGHQLRRIPAAAAGHEQLRSQVASKTGCRVSGPLNGSGPR